MKKLFGRRLAFLYQPKERRDLREQNGDRETKTILEFIRTACNGLNLQCFWWWCNFGKLFHVKLYMCVIHVDIFRWHLEVTYLSKEIILDRFHASHDAGSPYFGPKSCNVYESCSSKPQYDVILHMRRVQSAHFVVWQQERRGSHKSNSLHRPPTSLTYSLSKRRAILVFETKNTKSFWNWNLLYHAFGQL